MPVFDPEVKQDKYVNSDFMHSQLSQQAEEKSTRLILTDSKAKSAYNKY